MQTEECSNAWGDHLTSNSLQEKEEEWSVLSKELEVTFTYDGPLGHLFCDVFQVPVTMFQIRVTVCIRTHGSHFT